MHAARIATTCTLLTLLCSDGLAQQAPKPSIVVLAPDTKSLPGEQVVVLPNTQFHRKPKLPHKPFSVSDFKGAPPGLGPNSEITLKNGTRVRLSQFLDEINRIEQALNAYGYSLRKRSPKPIMLQSTKLAAVQPAAVVLRASRQAISSPLSTPRCEAAPTGPLPQAAPVQRSWPVLDKDIVGASLSFTSQVDNSFDSISVSDEVTVAVYIFGHKIDGLRVRSEAHVPASLAADPREVRRVVSKVSAFGETLRDTTKKDTGQNEANLSLASMSWSPTAFKISYWVPYGPFIVKVEAVIQPRLTLGANGHADIISAIDSANLSASLVLLMRVVGGVGVVSAGAQVAVDLLAAEFGYTNRGDLARMPVPTAADPNPTWRYSELSWTSEYDHSLTVGSGGIELTFVIDLWLLGEQAFSWRIYSWQGVDISSANPVLSSGILCRPPACGNRGSVCSSKCSNLGTDASNCGGCGVACQANGSCSSGVCRACVPQCAGKAPQADDGCGGKCRPCASTRYWCAKVGMCVRNAQRCQELNAW
jgi:hypothetical protein